MKIPPMAIEISTEEHLQHTKVEYDNGFFKGMSTAVRELREEYTK